MRLGEAVPVQFKGVNVQSISTLQIEAAGQMSMADCFREMATLYPARDALRYGEVCLSYAELHERVTKLANWMAAQGVGRGDSVAILSENSHRYVELVLAASFIGAIVACQNWRQAPPELAHCLKVAGPKLVFVSEKFQPKMAEQAVDVPVIELGEPYEEILRTGSADEIPLGALADEGLLLLYTSGTTGFPKGAVLTQKAMVARGIIGRVDGVIYPNTAYVAWTPMFHTSAIEPSLAVLMHGGQVVVLDGFNSDALIDVLERYEIGFLMLSPGVIGRMLEAMKKRPVKVRGVRLAGTMPDLVPADQLGEITRLLNAPYRNSFGSTEAGGIASRASIPVGVTPSKFSKEQSSYVRIRLVDEEGVDVPDETPGELLVRTPGLFSHYLGDPAATAEAFAGGWFHTGDVLVRHTDGSLDFVDRRKYLIKSGGENIYPGELERVLLSSDRIADAVVVRKPDAQWGEVPFLFVVARDQALTEDEVLALLKGKIAGYKMPKGVRFLAEEDIPRSTTDKVKRHELEKLLVQ